MSVRDSLKTIGYYIDLASRGRPLDDDCRAELTACLEDVAEAFESLKARVAHNTEGLMPVTPCTCNDGDCKLHGVPIHCEHCGKRLKQRGFVWLELNHRTGVYSTPGSVPAGESQGLFRFGRDCARRIIGGVK